MVHEEPASVQGKMEMLQSKNDQWKLRGGVLEETVQTELESITLPTYKQGNKVN